MENTKKIVVKKIEKKEKPESVNILPGKKLFGEAGIFEVRLLGEKNDGKILVYTNVRQGLWSLGRTLPKKYKA